jgi:3-oxoacyl-[acyl-carrier protein] reductase
MFRLDGKIAFVTGARAESGAHAAEALAAQGATVVVNYRQGRGRSRARSPRHRSEGRQGRSVGFDVADTKRSRRHRRHHQTTRQIDILVANAGIAIDGLLLRRQKDEDLDASGRPTSAARSIARARRAEHDARRWGRIVFMSSVVGEMGNVGQTAYAATKAALLGAARSIAREYASRNVTANVVAPGYIDTDMTGGR